MKRFKRDCKNGFWNVECLYYEKMVPVQENGDVHSHTNEKVSYRGGRYFDG
jgi:hypothetical protein